ncbi:HNH endonuclease signature motif containing protein [Nocardia farcinica]|uniref:HNH endonuclease signature motif containing protein n=1 Tax=Nocardia farcinica TaxID=37329 RepID=UPI002453F160|nr:HNH endonuclease signature motif containing protein [Nocardia farcinica]
MAESNVFTTFEHRLFVPGDPAPQQLPSHIIAAIEVGPSGCWLWQRSRSRDGYGWASLHNKTYQAHRLVYRLLKGEPPTGTVLDHTCRVRHCVNPDHLEPVTPRENLLRSTLTPTGMRTCVKGHEFIRMRRQRRCPICLAEYEERRRSAKARMERERRARRKAAN